jgi:hypothetical protein
VLVEVASPIGTNMLILRQSDWFDLVAARHPRG